MNAEPTPSPFRTAVRSVSAAVVRVFVRPWQSPVNPSSMGQIALFSVVLLTSLALLAAITSHASHAAPEWFAIAIFLGLCRLGDAMVFAVHEHSTADCSDLFYILGFAVLAPRDAVILVALAGALSMLFDARSFVAMISKAANFSKHVAALTAVVVVQGQFGHGVGATVAAVALAYMAMRIGEIAAFTAYHLGADDAPLAQRRKKLRTAIRSDILGRDAFVEAIAQAPMSLLGAFAWPYVQWSAILLAIPYLIAWRTARQSARLAEAERHLGIDSLTGLSNRARFFDRATQEIAQARHYGHGLALIMGDLDYFKRVNDTFGHLAGDEVLRLTATAMSGAVDDSVFPVARYGGEEFVVVLPVLARGEVLQLAESLRAAVEGALGEWNTSISLGVAYFEESDRLESLIDRADKALYSAKYAGKNRVHEWRGKGIDRPVAVDRAA